MTKHDGMMFAIYLVVIAIGSVMIDRQPLLGNAQMILGACLFGLRLYFVMNRIAKH